MRRFWGILILVLMLALSLTACGKDDGQTSGDDTRGEDSQAVTEAVGDEDSETDASDKNAVEVVQKETESEVEEPTATEPTKPVEGQTYSKLNGRVISDAAADRRPLAVMMDNHYLARPQAGLAAADIVYEVLVEGKITRYLAIFQSELPTDIGPIRSARPYFLRLAMEYDALYTHVGGSEQAKSEIKSFQMADIDGLSSGGDTFWRKNHKKMPNNMYASSESLLDWAKRKDYRSTATFDGRAFDYELKASETSRDQLKVKVVYKAPSAKDSLGYFIDFVYNEESKSYLRSVNGKDHLDEATGERLYADSIIIQRAGTKVIDSYGRLAIDVVGEGTGYYIADGKSVEIVWKKSADRERTVYYDTTGNELKIKPGKLWIQMVTSDYQL
ncbi:MULTISPECIES: DUF3048 domain-containing protein [unclassified Fusibacter]|uniref:DUF3048 domain-containing protein n=1 Tax=unclassified Fusibacter TaxID=2624464 RepID=UPI0010133991|nr:MULTISPECIES: DUF3048 domain-containing protein [unclassified Fusibacter]MCK8058108.1 DUF3048 domain-containing protein [Fusibacter sp. A2]NPE20690.1 DUF3048 domain-containing protein [Fusibacter sp. A1]RXV62896.1 DUF3048 domain-containing protein [Fusibacter sp. A1]